MGGWGETKTKPATSATGTTGEIEAARAALHAWGIVGETLADEAQQAARMIGELRAGRDPNPGIYC